VVHPDETLSPVSDPFARYQQAEKMRRAEVIQNTKIYFNPRKTIYEGNPQMILDRGEAVSKWSRLLLSAGYATRRPAV
jgi:hypothetical protein